MESIVSQLAIIATLLMAFLTCKDTGHGARTEIQNLTKTYQREQRSLQEEVRKLTKQVEALTNVLSRK